MECINKVDCEKMGVLVPDDCIEYGCSEASNSLDYQVICPRCGYTLKYLLSWWRDMNCPLQDYTAGCSECGAQNDVSPKITFVVK